MNNMAAQKHTVHWRAEREINVNFTSQITGRGAISDVLQVAYVTNINNLFF